MLNYYNLIATNLFIIYLLLRILPKLSKRLFLVIIIVFGLNFISVTPYNESIFYFATGFINYFSFTSFALLVFIITTAILSKKTTIFLYTSSAFMLMLLVFYAVFFIASYKLYDIGLDPSLILPFIFIYGIALLLISNKFILFNIIITMACLMLFSGLLQGNIWNYLLDPVLLIICIIEIPRALLIRSKFKYHNDELISY